MCTRIWGRANATKYEGTVCVCDLVDDIIICDRQGNPVIINGYKLVQASPYKKVWLNEYKSGKTTATFESWLAEQFGTVKDWNKITEQDWKRGKLDWNLSQASEPAQSAYKQYKQLGLGKPRLNIRLSARALWSSVFSENLWKTEWIQNAFAQSASAYIPLLKLVDYLKLANAVYILHVEVPVSKKYANNWVDWVIYKQGNQKSVNEELGIKVAGIRKSLIDETTNNTEEQQGSTHNKIVHKAVQFITIGFNITADKATAKQLADEVVYAETNKTKISADRRKQIREFFNTNIDNFLSQKIPGYGKYLQQKQKSHEKKSDYNDYIGMAWKGV